MDGKGQMRIYVYRVGALVKVKVNVAYPTIAGFGDNLVFVEDEIEMQFLGIIFGYFEIHTILLTGFSAALVTLTTTSLRSKQSLTMRPQRPSRPQRPLRLQRPLRP